ncbi:MAG: hypothetical protein ABF335_08750 [Alphaproteobacteria bacterium]
MHRLTAFLRLIAFLIVIILFVGIAVANRDMTLLNLDPFGSDTAALGLRMPLFVMLFGFFLLGFLAGALALCLGGGTQRKDARAHRTSAKQAERAERKAIIGGAKPQRDEMTAGKTDSDNLIAPTLS